jgi:type IV secretory pathway VirB10-like protein
MPRITPLHTGLISVAAVLLAACQPAAEAPNTPPAPPLVTDEAIAPVAPAAPETVSASHDAHQDEDDHANHDDDSHADHDEHAGGEAHVHGHAELAVVREGNTISISLESPLANYGLSETETDLGDTARYADQTAELIGGDCPRTERSVSARSDGQHGKMVIDLTFACDDASIISGVKVLAFDAFSGFDEIDAVALTDSGQNADSLSAANPVIQFP